MQNNPNITNHASTISKRLLVVIVVIISVFIVSCKNSVKKEINTSKTVEDIGYIISTEQVDNRFIDNGLFYFVPSREIDPKKPGLSFREKNFKPGYGFVLYSSYYIRLINAMSFDLIYYEFNLNEKDPFRLNLEFRRVLPVKIKFTYNSTYLKNTTEKDSILVDDGKRMFFSYKMVGKIKIENLEIKLPKKNDLSGRESSLAINHNGKFGIIVKK